MLLDVRSWLEAEGFGSFADQFEARQIDGDALVLLTDAHLREMGVPMGPRLKLLAAIARLTAGAHSTAERRRLTVMFVDLVGSTALSSRHDPEELRGLIRRYQEAVAAEVEHYEAYVARYLGDGALVYFGYPKAHEDDAERAVRAALAIVRAVSELRSPAGEPLAAHIGIATGLVVVGDLMGAAAAQERAVVGETPNIASRLQSIAAAGEVVVSAQTRSLTGNLFDWRELGPQMFKGVPEPVFAYAALAERPLESRFDARQGTSLAPMVGRDADLERLEGLWRRAAQGQGQFAVITGEAGIGKSRLLRAINATLQHEPHVRITNQCSPYHAESPLYPMIQQLLRAAAIQPGQAREAQLDRLDALLRGADATEAALIAALLGIDGASRYGPLHLTPEQQRMRTFEALVDLTIRLSARTPVLWVLEDAHWMDPTTLELLKFSVQRIAGARILAIVTARPEFADPLGERRHVTRIALSRLSRGEVTAMIGQLVGGRPLPDRIFTEILAKTDGVPLFVEELTKTVLESAASDALSVPASLHDSMMARLDRHAALKEVAQTAACIGREFGHDLLAAVCGMSPAAMREGLGRLEQAQLVFRRRATEERQYVFKHALLRDAAYESLLKSKRQEIHGRILGVLEASHESPAELLAQHAMQAGQVEKSIGYWEKAAMAAVARPAYREAIAHVREALALAETLGADRQWQERRLRLLVLLGQATIPLRGYSHSETMDAFRRAQQLIDAMEDPPHRFSVSYAMWVAHYVRGEHPQALAVAEDMRDHAQREGSDGRMLSALRAMGIGQMITGQLLEAQSTFEVSQKLAYVLQSQSREHRMAVAHRFAADPEIATQFHVGLTLWGLGHASRARDLTATSVAAARAMGHVHTLGHALVHGAIFAAVRRDAKEARDFSAEAIAFAEEHDMDLWRGYGSILNAYARVLEGEFAEAVEIMERGFADLRRTETGAMVPAYHAVQAYALARLGRRDEAAREAEFVQRELRSGCERYFWPEMLRWTGDYLRLIERPREAEGAYEQALSVARAQEAKSFELGAATSLARLWSDRGETHKARELLVPLYRSFAEVADTPFGLEAAALLSDGGPPTRSRHRRSGARRSASRVRG